jgi:uncharacterized membrane protein
MTLPDILTIVVAAGSGIIGGLLFTFSNAIMPGLARQPAPAGIRAMQAINVTILNPLFLSIITGTTILGVAAIGLAVFGGSLWAAAGAALYVAAFAITMGINVPMNERLKALTPDSAEAAAYWRTFLKDWVFWNSVRTVAALLGMVMLMASLVL